LVPAAYVRALEMSGAVPLLLVPPSSGADDAKAPREAACAAAERLDAVVLSGGADLVPALYGEDPHEQTQRPEPARDAYELALLAACASRGMPVLAICRGMQLLNVSRGGTLVQHLPDLAGGPDHMPDPGSFVPRAVRVVEGSRLASVLGRTDPVVPCHHHQAVDRVGRGLVVSARSDDGVIEALEDPGSGFLLAVQWHPEVDRDHSLFDALAQACFRNPRPQS
jgi:putative glutamine amidotransferase